MARSTPFKLKLVLGAVFLSSVSESMVSIAFGLKAAAEGQANLLSAILLASLLPQVLLGLWGGKLADTAIRWWWWPLALIFQALVYGVIALCTVWPAIILGTLAVSTVTALVGPVARKLANHHSTDPQGTGSWMSMIAGLAGVMGLAVGGLLVGQGLVQALLVTSSLELFCVALLACAVSGRDALAVEATEATGALLGFRILRSPQLLGRAGFLFLICCVLGTSLDDVVSVFVLTGHLHLSDTVFGFVSGCWALGIIIGSLLSPKIPAQHPIQVLIAGGMIMGAGIFSIAWLLPTAPGAAGIYLIAGAGNGVFISLMNSSIMGRVAEHQQGRAWAAYGWLVKICLLLGYLAGGLWGSAAPRELMLASGSIVLVAGTFALATLALCGRSYRTS